MIPLTPASVGTDLGEQGRSGGQPLPVVNAVAESISGTTAASCVPPAGATELVIDLCAGAGGWDEGARALGLDPVGLELDLDACRTNVASGGRVVRCDIEQMRRVWRSLVFEEGS